MDLQINTIVMNRTWYVGYRTETGHLDGTTSCQHEYRTETGHLDGTTSCQHEYRTRNNFDSK